MRNRTQEQYLKISVFIITLVMIVLRFLLNEKGRVTPDSIRFMRQANVFPEIDNTTGYMAAFFRQVKIGVLTLTLEKKQ